MLQISFVERLLFEFLEPGYTFFPSTSLDQIVPEAGQNEVARIYALKSLGTAHLNLFGTEAPNVLRSFAYYNVTSRPIVTTHLVPVVTPVKYTLRTCGYGQPCPNCATAAEGAGKWERSAVYDIK